MYWSVAIPIKTQFVLGKGGSLLELAAVGDPSTDEQQKKYGQPSTFVATFRLMQDIFTFGVFANNCQEALSKRIGAFGNKDLNGMVS